MRGIQAAIKREFESIHSETPISELCTFRNVRTGEAGGGLHLTHSPQLPLMHYITHISAFYRRNLCYINELGKPLLTLETRSLIMN